MQKALFLLCPTDCLESIINDSFKHENYFYTSLGNSFATDNITLEHIKELILKHHITTIYIVLSNDNKIILDALGRQFFSKIRGLQTFYKDITKQSKTHVTHCNSIVNEYYFFSYFLNTKIKGLQKELSNLLSDPIKINGKIYNKQLDAFSKIYSNLVFLEKYHLN